MDKPGGREHSTGGMARDRGVLRIILNKLDARGVSP